MTNEAATTWTGDLAATTLFERMWRGSQSVEYHEVLKLWRHTLQIKIDRDSYDQQSSAVIERWNGSEWKFVASIPWALMHTPNKAHGSVPVEKHWFMSDIQELLDLARNILD